MANARSVLLGNGRSFINGFHAIHPVMASDDASFRNVRAGARSAAKILSSGRRVLRRGGQLWYEPSALVCHAVPPNRLREPYFLAWWFDKSRAELLEFEFPKTQSGSSREFLCR